MPLCPTLDGPPLCPWRALQCRFRPDRQRPDHPTGPTPRPARSPVARPSTVDRRPVDRRQLPDRRPLPGASYPLPGGPAIRRSGYPAGRHALTALGSVLRHPAAGGYPTLPRPHESPWRPSQCRCRPSGGPRSAPIHATPAAGALAGRASVQTALKTVQFERWLYGNPPPASRRTGGVSRAPRRRSGPRSSPVYTIRRCPIYRRCISALKLHFTYLPAGRPS